MKTLIRATLFSLALLGSTLSFADDFDISKHPEFIELFANDMIALDIRYATSDNFIGRPVYTSARTYLHRDAYKKFEVAIELLKKSHPGYKFVIFDALRPRSVQWVLWNAVKGTPKQKYVGDPRTGSIHNYGFALDISLHDEKGRELDMGTPYDDFTSLAEPQKEQANLKSGKLKKDQLANRIILRKIMTQAGFRQLQHEWWHYDGLAKAVLVRNYKIVE